MKTIHVLALVLTFASTAAVSQQQAGAPGRIGNVGTATAPPSPSGVNAGTTAPPAAPAVQQPSISGAQFSQPQPTGASGLVPTAPGMSSSNAPADAAGGVGGAAGANGVAFRNLDGNGDGRLLRSELRDPALISNFRTLDMNNDGVLSEQEYRRFGTDPSVQR